MGPGFRLDHDVLCGKELLALENRLFLIHTWWSLVEGLRNTFAAALAKLAFKLVVGVSGL